MKYFRATLIIFMVALTACTSGEQKAARSMIKQAESQYTQGAYDTAIHLLDSLHTTYPSLVKERKEALALAQEIKLAKSTADSARVAPMLEQSIALLERMHQDFKEVKYPDMPDETILRYKGIDASADTNSPFLDAYLDHDGRLQLIAGCAAHRYQGVEYITVQETAGNTFVASDTIPYDGGRNYRFAVDGRAYERLTLSLEAGVRVAALISDTPGDTPIRVTFFNTAGREAQRFVLSERSRMAVKGCYDYFSTYVSIKDMEEVLNKHEQRRTRHYMAD